MSETYGFDGMGGLSPPVKVWQEPEQGKLYSLGVDTAEGLGHGDQSSVQVLEVNTGEQCAAFTERIPPDLLAVVAYRMAAWFNNGLLVVEANNHGLATINQLRQIGYRSLFRRRQINHTYNRQTEEYGFKTTRSSKPMIIAALDEALRGDEIAVHEPESYVELKGYVRDDRGSMGGSPFDDRVMALALAHHGRAFMHLRVVEDQPSVPYMSFRWWSQLDDGPAKGHLVVGAHARRERRHVVR